MIGGGVMLKVKFLQHNADEQTVKNSWFIDDVLYIDNRCQYLCQATWNTQMRVVVPPPEENSTTKKRKKKLTAEQERKLQEYTEWEWKKE